MTYLRQLGKIRHAEFGLEDHGIFRLCLTFDFGSSSQAFAPLLWGPSVKDPERYGRLAIGCWQLLFEVMSLFKVDLIEEIKGRYAYAIRDEDTFSAYIKGIEMPEAEGSAQFNLTEWALKWGTRD